jgi:MoxR-like ATPase
MRFEGTSGYVASEDLKVAVNAAITLERPLLVKGEPGTGKTVLALEIAKALDAPLLEWHIKSTTKALQGLYEYDAVSRLRDSQLGDERIRDIRNYIKRGKLWDAFVSEQRPVLLIDEIDKADIEFPNDLLQELDRMEFYIYETSETIRARRRPIVIITSNNEKELPDAFLRRCFFHYIRFPDPETMRAIIAVHFPGIKQRLVAEALKLFYEIREVPGLKKKPSTSELLDWLKLLLVEDIEPETLRERDPKKLIPPLHGALLKNEQDVHLFERLAFMARREAREARRARLPETGSVRPRQFRPTSRRRTSGRRDSLVAVILAKCLVVGPERADPVSGAADWRAGASASILELGGWLITALGFGAWPSGRYGGVRTAAQPAAAACDRRPRGPAPQASGRRLGRHPRPTPTGREV